MSTRIECTLHFSRHNTIPQQNGRMVYHRHHVVWVARVVPKWVGCWPPGHECPGGGRLEWCERSGAQNVIGTLSPGIQPNVRMSSPCNALRTKCQRHQQQYTRNAAWSVVWATGPQLVRRVRGRLVKWANVAGTPGITSRHHPPHRTTG